MSPTTPLSNTYRTDQVVELTELFSQKCGVCGRSRGDHSYRRLHCPDISDKGGGGFTTTTFGPGTGQRIRKRRRRS